jgi:flagella basal body P-ring formation protein FlgA
MGAPDPVTARPASPHPEPAPKPGNKPARADGKTTAAATDGAPAKAKRGGGKEPLPSSVADAIAAFVRPYFPGEEFSLNVTALRGSDPIPADAELQVRRLASGDMTGRAKFLVGVRGDAGTWSDVVVDAEVAVEVEALMLRKSYIKDQLIDPKDAFIGKQPYKMNLAFLDTDPGVLAGKAATRNIPARRGLVQEDISEPFLVRTRTPVLVISDGRGYEITFTGIAREDGRLADMIAVEDPKTRILQHVTVTGPNRVRFQPSNAAPKVNVAELRKKEACLLLKTSRTGKGGVVWGTNCRCWA